MEQAEHPIGAGQPPGEGRDDAGTVEAPARPDRGLPVQHTGAPARPPPPVGARSRFPIGARALSALRHRNFRLFYFGQVLSLVGTWMQSTAQGWLVLELTNSAFLLGAVTAAGSLPILLLTLYAGVLADRADKRTIILTAQTASMLGALALAVLIHTGIVNVGWILLLVTFTGVASAFEVPTRQSFFVELVGKEDLTNAIALNSSAFNLTRIVGPALAGMLIGAVGIAACYYLNALSYVAVIAGLLAIRRPPFQAPPRTASTAENLREGFAYLWENRLARTLVILIAAASILALPYSMLLPVFARDVLQVGARGLGLLLSASGAGALAGGIVLASAAGRVRRGPLLLSTSALFAVLLGAFSLSRSFPLSLVLLAGSGFCLITFTATVNAMLQTVVPDRLRGRVMSVYVFMFLGMTPLGSLQAGTLARWIGAPGALAVGTTLLLLSILVVASRVPELRAAR